MDKLLYFLVVAVLMASALFFLKDRSLRKIIVVGGALILFLEVFVFNYACFGRFFGRYTETPVDLNSSSVYIEGIDGDSLAGNSETGVLVEIPSLSQPVYGLKLDLDFESVSEYNPGTPFVQVTIDAKDDTYQACYRYSVADGNVIRDDDRSSLIRLNLSGNVHALRIQFVSTTGKYVVRGVTLNPPIPLRLSPVRSAILFGIVLLFCLLFCLARSGETCNDRPLRIRQLCFFAALVFILGAFSMTQLSFFDNYGYLAPLEGSEEEGNQITKEIVDAFEAGRVSLLEIPDEKLLALDNPYDWSQRIENEAEGLWDHLLYNGKYYSYYGIAPVLLLFLPFHLITGLYFSSASAVLIFGILGIIFLTMLFLKMCDDWFARVPIVLLFCSYLILLSSCGIFYCFFPSFYEIAQSSGFMFTAAGFYCLIRSNVVYSPAQSSIAFPQKKHASDPHRIRNGYVALSAVCLALSVLCRPTLALYCVVSLIFYGFGFFRIWRDTYDCNKKDRKKAAKRLIPYLLCFVIPYAIIGGGQMIYNYLRFGSFFDFGIQYSLTINDFTRSQFHLDFVQIGFYNFLFAFPHFVARFPFVESGFSDLDVNGYYFIANKNAVGLFWKALPAWGVFSAPFVMKKLTGEEKKKFVFLLLPLSVIAPLCIIFSIWESGYGVRYCADFNWQILICGLILFFVFYVRFADKQLKSFLTVFFCGSAVLSVWINIALLYEYLDLSGFLADSAMSFAGLFDFWI